MHDTFQEVVISAKYKGEEEGGKAVVIVESPEEEGGKAVVIVESPEDKVEKEARTVSSTCRAERPS
jgi:hypothetical protein